MCEETGMATPLRRLSQDLNAESLDGWAETQNLPCNCPQYIFLFLFFKIFCYQAGEGSAVCFYCTTGSLSHCQEQDEYGIMTQKCVRFTGAKVELTLFAALTES